jgi:LysM repeat protein
MNTPNPLLPQGALPPRGGSSLYFKILVIFAVHIVLLGGILMVGCKNTSSDKAKTDQSSDVAKSDPMSATPPDYSAPAPSAPAPAPAATLAGGTSPLAPSAPQPGTVSQVPSPAPAIAPLAPIPAATGGSVYVIAAGDLLSTIAKKNGVSLKAIEDANPGIDAKKLQIGHKLQIPASTAAASSEATKPGVEPAASASGDSSVYVVKTGDNLLKIAKEHGTTVKAIQALNDMKTTSIKATQKLKVPVMKMASAADVAPAAPAAPAPSTPASPARN